jgi:hypothetical protein
MGSPVFVEAHLVILLICRSHTGSRICPPREGGDPGTTALCITLEMVSTTNWNMSMGSPVFVEAHLVILLICRSHTGSRICRPREGGDPGTTALCITLEMVSTTNWNMSMNQFTIDFGIKTAHERSIFWVLLRRTICVQLTTKNEQPTTKKPRLRGED